MQLILFIWFIFFTKITPEDGRGMRPKHVEL